MADSPRRLRPIEALERDVIASLTGATIATEFWVDLEAADRVVRERRATGDAALTLPHPCIKAAACAVARVPDLHRMYGPFSAIDPAHADVGVSVLGGAMVQPVVVIRQADLKPLVAVAPSVASASSTRRRPDSGSCARTRRKSRAPPAASAATRCRPRKPVAPVRKTATVLYHRGAPPLGLGRRRDGRRRAGPLPRGVRRRARAAGDRAL